jgi:hypothetical protein
MKNKIIGLFTVIALLACSSCFLGKHQPERSIYFAQQEEQQLEHLFGGNLQYLLYAKDPGSLKKQYKFVLTSYPGANKFYDWLKPMPNTPTFFFRIGERGPGVVFVDKNGEAEKCYKEWLTTFRTYFHDEGEEYFIKDGIFLVKMNKYYFLSPDLGLLKEIIGKFYSQATNEIKLASFWSSIKEYDIAGLLLYKETKQPFFLQALGEYKFKQLSFFMNEGADYPTEKVIASVEGAPLKDKLGVTNQELASFIDYLPDDFDFYLFLGVSDHNRFLKFVQENEVIKNFKWSEKRAEGNEDLFKNLKPGIVVATDGKGLFDKDNNSGRLTRFAIYARTDKGFLDAWQEYLKKYRINAQYQNKEDIHVWSWTDIKKTKLSYVLIYNSQKDILVLSNTGTWGKSFKDMIEPAKHLDSSLLSRGLN